MSVCSCLVQHVLEDLGNPTKLSVITAEGQVLDHWFLSFAKILQIQELVPAGELKTRLLERSGKLSL